MYELFFLPPNNSTFFFQNHAITFPSCLTFYKILPFLSLTFYKKHPKTCLTFYKKAIFADQKREK